MARTKTLRILLPVAPLLLGVAILLAGQGLQNTLLPVRANLEAFSTLSIGLLGGAYYLGFTLGCLRGSSLVRRVGHVRVFAAMTAAASAAPLLHGLWVDFWPWLLLRVITGFCFATLFVVIESWLNEHSSNETRGTVFSAYILITLTLMAAGQQLLQVYDPNLINLFAIASALVSIAAIPVVMSIGPAPSHEEAAVRLDLRRLFTISPVGALGCLVAGLSQGSFWSLAPVFVAGYSTDVSMAAWFMTAAILGGAAGQWPLGLWSDRIDRRWVMVLATLVCVVTGLLMWWSFKGLSTTVFLLLSAAWGAAAFPIYSIAVAHANDNADAGEYVVISSSLLLMFGLGAVLGPLLAPSLMNLTGGGGLYLFTALAHLALLVLIAARIRRREAPPSEEHLPFSDSLAAVQTASQVYEEEM